jgi:hypothetical protein
MYPLHARKTGLLGLASFSLMGAAGGMSAAPTGALPSIEEWIVVGPFPQRLSDATDFLAPLGGETAAVLKEGVAVTFRNAGGQEITLTARRVVPDATGLADLGRLFPRRISTESRTIWTGRQSSVWSSSPPAPCPLSFARKAYG